MTNRIFLPPLDTQWRLKSDWTPDEFFLKHSDNVQTLYGETGYYWQAWEKATGNSTKGTAHGPDGWITRAQAWRDEQRELRGLPEFAAGTIFQIERYHVSRSGDNQITVKVMISPEPKLTPKKLGGKMAGAGRLYFTLAQFNTLPIIEEVDTTI